MRTSNLLSGKTVVVTRPHNQTRKICAALKRNRAAIIHFPVLSIMAAENPEPAKNTLRQLATYDVVIFISGNAVHYAVKLAQELKLDFHDNRLAAVGAATRAALEKHGYSVSIVPATSFTSEALLACEPLQRVAGQKILIVRGKGGREYLRQQLQARGAHVDYTEVYQRRLPAQRDATDLSKLPERDTAVLIYSAEAAQNLWSLCTVDEKKWLTKATLIVGSERIASEAASTGFTNNPIIAENPGDEAMLQALINWADVRKSP